MGVKKNQKQSREDLFTVDLRILRLCGGLPAREDVRARVHLLQDGHVVLTDKPGLGVELNEDFLSAQLEAGESLWH